MDRKIEVGDEYEHRMRMRVEDAPDQNGWLTATVVGRLGCGSQFRVHSSSLDSATLVWRRERPLAVGDRVRSVLWPADATPRTIVFIEGDEAILSTGDRLSGPHSITSLRRADA